MKVSKTISTKIKENPSDLNEVRKKKQQHQIVTLLDFSEIMIPEEFAPFSLEDLDFKVVAKEIPVIVTGFVSSGASLTTWGEGASLALVGHPSRMVSR